ISDVLLATSFTIWAPMFSSASFKSISFATVTPSLVIVGEPNFRSRMTFRPLGPSVTFTAFVRLLIPRRIAWREESPYVIWFAIMCSVKERRPLRHRRDQKSGSRAFLDSATSPLDASIRSGASLLDCQHVFLFHDQVLHPIQFDFLPGVLAEED